MPWTIRVKEAFSSRQAFLKAIEAREVDGEEAVYNEDLLPTEPGRFLCLKPSHLRISDKYSDNS